MSEFFEPGTVYIEGSNPYRAPELTSEFHCLGVHKHPSLDVTFAVGWWRDGHFDQWGYGLSALTAKQWEDGKWVVSPYDGTELEGLEGAD